MTILIIEDDAGLSELLKECLEEGGYDTVCKRTGTEATAWLNDHVPFLMLLDYGLPDMNGKAVIDGLRKAGRPIPDFIVATGQGDERIAVDMMKLGARDYVVKDARFLDRLPSVVARVEKEIENENRLRRAEAALKESEERFALALKGSNDGIWDWNRTTDEIFFSARWKEIIGYADHEIENTVAEWKRRIHPDDFEAVMAANDLFYHSDESHFEIEYRLMHKDGRYRWILGRGTCLRDESGIPCRMSGSNTNITKRKTMEEELRHAHKMEAIGTITGGVAHDFNNILDIIIGNAELALDDIAEANPARFHVREIKTAGLRAAGIVKQLLTFSRKTGHALRPTGIMGVIRETLGLLRSTIPSSVEIRTRIPSLEESVIADPVQINQVVMNLCINAAQAMEETGGVVEVRAEKTTLGEDESPRFPDLNAGEYVRITVGDTGPGIPPHIITKIFTPYFTTKGVGKGSGMGLAVVHGIVIYHGGAIVVDSEPGKGALFTVMFPLAQAPPETEVPEIPRPGNETVLLVDDEEAVVDMTTIMLKRLGYRVVPMTKPEEALAAFQSDPVRFDVVVTDMTMPRMSGVSLSQKLMAIRSDIPVILCTGHSPLIDEEGSAALGIAEYLLKPVAKETIANAIRRALDKPK